MEYSLPSMQSMIETNQLIEVPCFTSLPREDSTPLDFRIDRSDLCIDPTNAYLYVRCKITKTASADEEVVVYPTNNLGYSMFQSVDMYINDQKITHDQVLYPWLSYVICLTQYSEQYRKTILRTSLWRADTAGTMDTAREDNRGAVARQQRISTTGTLELYSKVLTDHIQLPRVLPVQTEVLYRFTPANASLFLFADKGSFKMTIFEARMYIGKAQITEALPRELVYPVSRYQSRSKTVNAGEQNVSWVPFSGRRPRRIYLCQISQKAYNGDITKNPFRLQTFDLRRIQVHFNELSLPTNTALQFGADNAVRCYFNTAMAINNPLAWNIALDEYVDGFFLYAVDLTNDRNANGEYVNATKSGSVRISMDYRAALREAITILCFAEYDDVLTIDEFGNAKWT